MIDNENLKIGLISVLHTIITNYEPEENSKIINNHSISHII